MAKKIIRLYPQNKILPSARGAYLRKSLHRQGFILYADFLSSIDGRIAVGARAESALPERLTSGDDFRLLLELRAQADCLVTHGGYLRARHSGRLGDVLGADATEAHADLVEWRRAQGMPEQPLILICSASLDFPPPSDVPTERVHIVTGNASDSRAIAEWTRRGYRVTAIGDERHVCGGALIEYLRELGVNGVFLLAGPMLFESLLAARGIQHLFFTVAHRLIGTPDFLTMLPGLASVSACRLRQKELLYICDDARDDRDAAAHWMAHFECAYD